MYYTFFLNFYLQMAKPFLCVCVCVPTWMELTGVDCTATLLAFNHMHQQYYAQRRML